MAARGRNVQIMYSGARLGLIRIYIGLFVDRRKLLSALAISFCTGFGRVWSRPSRVNVHRDCLSAGTSCLWKLSSMALSIVSLCAEYNLHSAMKCSVFPRSFFTRAGW